MRLERAVAIAGIEPDLARSIARACLHDWAFTERVAHVVKIDLAQANELLRRLQTEGYVTNEPCEYEGEPDLLWSVTLRGSALAGASFLKPITRAKAEALLVGVLERAAAYNADLDKIVWIEEISLFGSLLVRHLRISATSTCTWRSTIAATPTAARRHWPTPVPRAERSRT
ncbi:hypothetical protein [Myceligenerans crystallogenes]|uniref:Uncharacterized protein n=1 Tax=Myceligenerans crystallogenes TaxID=316335 RepID=A0ABN2NLG1_9MICO